MRNGVSRCARSHDATRQRDAVKRRCSGRGTLRQTPDPASFPACSPASFSACPPVRLQSMRFSGQLPTHARPAPQPFAADPLRGGTRSTPSSGRDSPDRVSLFIRAVSILRPPYSGRSTVIDSQYNSLFKSRSIPAEGGSGKPLHRKRIFSFPGPPVPTPSCPHPVGTQANGFPAPPAALPPVPSHLPDHFPTSSSLGQSPPCWLPLLPFRPISSATRRSRRQPGRRRAQPVPGLPPAPPGLTRLPRSKSSLTVIDNHSQSVPNMPKGQRATCARPDAWERPAFCFRHPFRSLWPGSTPSPVAVRFGMTTLPGMDSHNLS